MKIRLPTCLLLAVLFGTGCRACDGPATPTALLDRVPAESELVVLVDLPRLLDEARRVSPWSAFPSRWNDLVEDLESYVETHFGVQLLESTTLAFWQSSGVWGATVRGDFDGELTGETVDIAGTRAVALESDVYLAVSEDTLVIGNPEGLAHGLQVAAGTAPNLADSAEHSAELLRELLQTQAGSILSVAGLGMTIADDLSQLGLDVRAAGFAWWNDEWVVRARLPDEDSAGQALEQIESMVTMGRSAIAEAAAEARNGPPEAALPTILAVHAADVFTEEMLDLEVDGDMLVATLDLGSMESGAALLAGLASVSIPNYFTYIRRAQTVEAETQLRQMQDAALIYYAAVPIGPQGELLPARFPESVPRTPAAVPCGQATPADASLWEHPTWQVMHFAPIGPLRYSFQFDSQGTGAAAEFTASAFGDLDCDGVLSTYQLQGAVVDGIVETSGLNSLDELE